MYNPVNEAKDQTCNQISPGGSNVHRNISDMYNIHQLHGQPEHYGVNYQAEKADSHEHKRERQDFHQRLNESVQEADYEAGHHKKQNSASILDVMQKIGNAVKRHRVQHNSKNNFFDHKSTKIS